MILVGALTSISNLKQEQRRQRVANVSPEFAGPITSADKDILSRPVSELVSDVHKNVLAPRSILASYGKAALKVHKHTNCVTEFMFEDAKTWADNEINLRGPLAGVPVSLKDSIAVKDYDVTVGFSRYCFQPYSEDGPMVKLLKDAGAIPFVKTALPVSLLSFESTNDVWGRCTNPHNKNYSPGGSTGGEGALLAGGGSRIGIGSDVAGSVRAPAHFSGCYSLRCSTGRWPKMGNNTSMPGQEGIASVFSPMTRTLPDLVYFSQSLISMRPWMYDHTVHPMPWRTGDEAAAASKQTYKVGVMRTDGVVDPSPAVARALNETIEALRADGHEIQELIPPSPYEALVIASQLLISDGTATFRSFYKTGEWDDPGAKVMRRYMQLPRWIKWLHGLYLRYIKRDTVWAGLLEHWYPKTATQQWTWVAKREAYRARFYEWWKNEAKVDFILCPPNATPAVPHDGMHDAVSSCGYTFMWNLLDYTAGIIPVTRVDKSKDALPKGFSLRGLNGVAQGAMKLYDADKMHGLPVAVQVVGKRLEEEKVLSYMVRIEDALDKQGKKYKLLELDDLD